MKDPFPIFLHANDFHNALVYLSSNEAPSHMAVVAFPALVLAAFASELFLKCIICMDGKKVPKWHDLKNLFDLTSQSSQRRMEKHWASMLDHRADIIARMEKSTGQKFPRDLSTCLALGSGAFEQLRYSYERGSTIFFLSDFPAVARLSILEVKPEWAATRRNISKL
jgi:hypothetical protein